MELEIKDQENKTPVLGRQGNVAVLMTPPIDEAYWMFRVQVGEGQAIVGFPKFTTIGIGFAKEEDWNTNLPYKCETLEIWDHIKHNKGNPSIKDEDCIAAIRMVQEAATKYMDERKAKSV